MKKIYVAHPFGGKKENYQSISDICNRLTAMKLMPISPVHAFSFLDDLNHVERKQALVFCIDLMKFADEVWVFGDWGSSEGCKAEVKEATLQLKPVRIVTGWKDGYPTVRDRYQRAPSMIYFKEDE